MLPGMLAPQEIRTFFVTSVTAGRRAIFQAPEKAKLLLQILAEDQAKGRYALHSFVLMRDHFHLLLTPAEEVSLEKAVQFVKGGFSFRLKSRFPVWERSFTEHRIRDAEDFENHRRYIEQNPVKAGYPSDYLYTSVAQQHLVVAAPEHLRRARG